MNDMNESHMLAGLYNTTTVFVRPVADVEVGSSSGDIHSHETQEYEVPPITTTPSSTAQSHAVTESDTECPCPWASCLTILRNTDLSSLYAAYVNKCLCADSVKFLRDTMAYERAVYASTQDQVSVVCD